MAIPLRHRFHLLATEPLKTTMMGNDSLSGFDAEDEIEYQLIDLAEARSQGIEPLGYTGNSGSGSR